MVAKPKLALYWASSCGGCDIAVLGLHEKILDVAATFEIVFWPCVIDAKIADVEMLDNNAIDVCLFNGAIRNDDNAHMAHLLRQKSKVLIAFGSCAFGGAIPGLANLGDRDKILDWVYYQSPTTDNRSSVWPRSNTKVPKGRWRCLHSGIRSRRWRRSCRWTISCPAARQKPARSRPQCRPL